MRQIHPRRLFHVFSAINHVGYIGEVDRRAIAVSNDDLLISGAGK